MINKFIKGFRFLLCVIDIYGNYAWIIPLSDKKGITITNTLQKTLHEFNCKGTKYLQIKAANFIIDQ